MFTFISDLDHTLVYSHQKDGVCVEFLNGCELTYMTPATRAIFYELLKQDDFLFIPYTARNYSQASRIEFIRNLPYMICDLGGSVYVNGEPDPVWISILKERRYCNPVAIEGEKNWIQQYFEIPYIKQHCNQDLFFVLVFKNTEEAWQAWNRLKKRTNPDIRYYLQGRKVYCVPTGLDKLNAVQYLIEQYHLKNVHTSGDSFFDKKFTEIGTALLPAHASITHNTEYRTKATGMQAGEELIKQIEGRYRKTNSSILT